MSAVVSPNQACTAATANSAGCFVDLRVSPGASYAATVHVAYGSAANSISEVDCINLASGTMWDSTSGECTAALSSNTVSFTSMAASTASNAAVPVLSINNNTGRLPRPVTNFYGALSEVTVRDDGYSIPFKNGVLFMFGDTVVINPTDGSFRAMPSSTAILTKGGAEYVSGGILEYSRDPNYGSPNQELTRGAHAETLAQSETDKANGVRIAYWNAGGVPTPGANNQEAQVFFGRFRIGCKAADGSLRKMSTCNPDAGEAEFYENTGIYADRLRANATLTRTDGIVVPAITTDNAKSALFTGTQLRFRPSGLVEGGYAYFIAGKVASVGVAHLYLARVPQNDVRNLAAFSYWDGTKYQSDITKAKAISDTVINATVGQGTISYNAHLGRYVMVDQVIGSNNGRILVANRPEGPWVKAADIIGLPAVGTYKNYFFMEHPALQRNNGKTIVLSYSNMPALGQQNLQMVEVTFN